MNLRKTFGLTLLSLILTPYFLILPPPAAASIYNRSPWPSAYRELIFEKDNTDALDAAHPCDLAHGRSFKVTHPETVKLSGLSVYVYLMAANENRFDQNAFRLSLLQLPSYELLVTRIPPTYANVIARENSASPTFEVFFPLDINVSGGMPYTAVLECLSNEADLYRLPESSRVADGLTEYYDSNTSRAYPYYLSGRKVLFTTFIAKGAPHFPPVSSSPTSSLSPLTSPKYHPVILIHGLGGRPENFENEAGNRNYVRLLTDQGYPKDFIHLYSYGYKEDARGQRYYNYQGDVREIAQGLESVVNSLSEKHKGQGGDGKVDIVAHSLGNLVARQYLYTHASNHKIRRFVAIGAPFKGAWFMSLDKNIRSIPIIGKGVEKVLADAVLQLYNKDAVGKISKDSTAAVQGTPGSEFLDGPGGINSKKIVGLELYTIYGDVSTTVRQKIFGRTVETKLSLGDGLILPDSSSFTGWVESPARKFAYSGGMLVDVKFSRDQGAFAAEIKVDDPKSAKSLHSELLTRSDTKQRIFCLLKEESANGC